MQGEEKRKLVPEVCGKLEVKIKGVCQVWCRCVGRPRKVVDSRCVIKVVGATGVKGED